MEDKPCSRSHFPSWRPSRRAPSSSTPGPNTSTAPRSRVAPNSLTEFRDLVADAKHLYRADTGKAPAKIALRDPVRTLGPDWHLRRTGTYGAFNHLIVLRDRKLRPTEFALSR